jgi:hypothetical protein
MIPPIVIVDCPPKVTQFWHPSVVLGARHHFIVTDYGHGDVRVAYELVRRDGRLISTRFDCCEGLLDDADKKARWLEPQAELAWFRQRSTGWVGQLLTFAQCVKRATSLCRSQMAHARAVEPSPAMIKTAARYVLTEDITEPGPKMVEPLVKAVRTVLRTVLRC